jgi:predicted small secreted protein
MKTRRNSVLFVLLTLPVLGVALSLLPACNTVEGVGKDTKVAGQGIENAADRNK